MVEPDETANGAVTERVLIVEDDPATRVGLAELVGAWGFQTEVAANGEEEELASESIRPEEISPELLYTAEHPVFVPPSGNGPTSRPASSDVVPGTDGREGGSAGKRRRGRRGGRRGRGNDEPNSTGGQ